MENIGIKGNESEEELVNKVSQANNLEGKISVCVMIITILAARIGMSHLDTIHTIARTRKYPIEVDPREKLAEIIAMKKKLKIKHNGGDVMVYEQKKRLPIDRFLFLLQKSENKCYLRLIDMYCQMFEESARKQNLILYLFLGAILLFIILSLSGILDSWFG